VDALVLPYRSGTATQNVDLAYGLGAPVIATRVGTIPAHVRDGVDGILTEAGSVDALTSALNRFYAPGMPARLRSAVRPADTQSTWAAYVQAVESAFFDRVATC
jgi:glycosyltransferase involved in cell wall biosynthesis